MKHTQELQKKMQQGVINHIKKQKPINPAAKVVLFRSKAYARMAS